MPSKNKLSLMGAPSCHEWTTGAMVRLTENFSTYEFECPCDRKDCKRQFIKIDLLKKLEMLRRELNEPLRIKSGYRCKKYQEVLKKKGYKTAKKSQHLEGAAVDLTLARKGGADWDKRIRKFHAALPGYFRAIGSAKHWAHVDMRDDKERRWTY